MNLTYTVSNNTHCHSQAIMKFIGTCLILMSRSRNTWLIDWFIKKKMELIVKPNYVSVSRMCESSVSNNPVVLAFLGEGIQKQIGPIC